MRSCWRAQHPMVTRLVKQSGKMKKLHELTTNQKHRHFEVSSSLILRDNSEQFLIRLRHAKASGFYATTGKDQLSGWTKKKLQSTSQSQTCTKTRSWSPFDGLLPVWCTTAFWILVKPLHWELSSANRWEAPKTAMPTSGIVQQKGLSSSPRQHPTSCRTTSASKVEWIGLKVLPYPPYSPEPSPMNYHFFKHLDNFLQGKCFPRVHQIPKHGFSCYRNRQTYFSLTKMCWS